MILSNPDLKMEPVCPSDNQSHNHYEKDVPVASG